MRVQHAIRRRARIEILPLIDIVFLLLVFFIYAMLSMAVHKGLPVALPESASAEVDKRLSLSVTVRTDGSVFLDKTPVRLEELDGAIRSRADKGGSGDVGVLVFADRDLSYQALFRVLDEIREAGISRISLQAEGENAVTRDKVTR